MLSQPVQTRECQAAVVRNKGGPFALEQVTIGPLRPDEILVRIVATGMCHTDMVARDQVYPVPQPIVLGHEGAGIVVAVGPGVDLVEKARAMKWIRNDARPVHERPSVFQHEVLHDREVDHVPKPLELAEDQRSMRSRQARET